VDIGEALPRPQQMLELHQRRVDIAAFEASTSEPIGPSLI
jgi:hypothetical protein